MNRLATLALLLLLAAGCKSDAPAPAARPEGGATTELPAHPVVSKAAGRWGQGGRMLVEIILQPDRSALLHVPDVGAGWRVEIRNARVEDGKIRFDQYHHVTDAPSHPLDGVRCDVVFEPTAGFGDRATLTISADQTEPKTYTLRRMK